MWGPRHQINLGLYDSLPLQEPSQSHQWAEGTAALPALHQLFLRNRVLGQGLALPPPRAPREVVSTGLCPLILPKFSGQGRSGILEVGGKWLGCPPPGSLLVFLGTLKMQGLWRCNITASQPQSLFQIGLCLILQFSQPLPDHQIYAGCPLLCVRDPS